jgi:hypothetical protein
MIRFISLLMLAGLLVAMIQSFNTTEPINLITRKEKDMTTDHKRQRAQITSVQQTEMKQQTGGLRDEMMGSLKHANVDKTASQLIVDAIIEANDPIARSFPVDENVYNQEGEIEQPLEALNESNMRHELESAGLNAEQNQIIVDGIAEANFDSR